VKSTKDGSNKLLGKLVRMDDYKNKSYRNQNSFDATKPSVLIVLTLAYIAIAFCLIVGIPWQGHKPDPIPPEDLPVAIPIFVVIYIVLIGGLYLRDRLKK